MGQISKSSQNKAEESDKKPRENEGMKKSQGHGIELKEKTNKLEFDDRERDYQVLMEAVRPFLTKKAIT